MPGDIYKNYEMAHYCGDVILEIGTFAGRRCGRRSPEQSRTSLTLFFSIDIGAEYAQRGYDSLVYRQDIRSARGIAGQIAGPCRFSCNGYGASRTGGAERSFCATHLVSAQAASLINQSFLFAAGQAAYDSRDTGDQARQRPAQGAPRNDDAGGTGYSIEALLQSIKPLSLTAAAR